jgi:hypothetical protein
MINAATKGYPKQILDVKDIVTLAKASSSIDTIRIPRLLQ